MTGLFLRAAYYERRVHVTSGLCQGCLVAEVSQRWYAHRSRQNLMVMELNITYYGGSASALPPLLLLLNNTIGGPSPDLKTESLPPPSDIARGCADMALPSLHCLLPVNTSITIAETNTPEIQGGGTFTVAWAADTVPETIEVNSSIPPPHHSRTFTSFLLVSSQHFAHVCLCNSCHHIPRRLGRFPIPWLLLSPLCAGIAT